MKDFFRDDTPNERHKFVPKYFDYLVSQFYKILPMNEADDETLPVYLENFKQELIGYCGIGSLFGYDARFITTISVLQYLIDNPESKRSVVRQNVFKAINICKKLKAKYGGG